MVVHAGIVDRGAETKHLRRETADCGQHGVRRHHTVVLRRDQRDARAGARHLAVADDLARLRTQLRRTRPASMGERLSFGDIILDAEASSASTETGWRGFAAVSTAATAG